VLLRIVRDELCAASCARRIVPAMNCNGGELCAVNCALGIVLQCIVRGKLCAAKCAR
jgi:hypothetical protein